MASPHSVLTPVAEEFGQSHSLNDISYQAKGAFKETFKAITADKQAVALKILDPSKCNLARSQREIEALKKCDSPFIAKLYDHGEFKARDGNSYYYSVEEYLDGGTLAQQMAPTIAPSIVRSYALQLSQALDHLKQLNLVHRDIKPDNIMFRKDHNAPVLVDFGLVRDLSASSLTQTWLPAGPGTPFFAAPEQLNNDKHLIGWRTDQFSLGVVLGICLVARHPYAEAGMTMPQTVAAVARRVASSVDFRDEVSTLGFASITKMVAPWPIQRFATPAHLIQSLV